MRVSDHLEVQEANANDSYDSSFQNDDSMASAFANESQQNEVLGMDSVGEEPEQELPTAPVDISPDLANLRPPTSTDAAASRDDRDLIKYFPYNIHHNLYRKPASMREPLERPTFFLELAVYFVFMAVKTSWNVPVRALNYLLQCTWILISYSYALGKRKYRLPDAVHVWNVMHNPFTNLMKGQGELFEDFGLHPAFTVETIANRVGIYTEFQAHPVCVRKDCQQVYHGITDREDFKSVGITCTACARPFAPEKGVNYLAEFPRQSVITELERVLAIPGIEDLCFIYKNRTNGRPEDEGIGVARAKGLGCLGRGQLR
ncbi:hypothetical protein QFC24_006106 [Naganishia onofrii]|uniref:Uncharacterized protein n=1 Tax=Naganishia onofrii TaxID=1851511 RepID=A0ACC2X4D4_9TREE|nr:hypothetical protein QFC24_006106 [Naganishia onofrii]